MSQYTWHRLWDFICFLSLDSLIHRILSFGKGTHQIIHPRERSVFGKWQHVTIWPASIMAVPEIDSSELRLSPNVTLSRFFWGKFFSLVNEAWPYTHTTVAIQGIKLPRSVNIGEIIYVTLCLERIEDGLQYVNAWGEHNLWRVEEGRTKTRTMNAKA